MKLGRNITLLLVSVLFLFCGCIHQDQNLKNSQKTAPSITGQIKAESDALASKQKQRAAALNQPRKKPIPLPVLPKYNPLENHKVSFAMINEPLETILYLLAETVGMNLLLDGKFTSGNNLVTINFENVSAKTVLRELTQQFDLTYQINENIIKISDQTERFYSLNFLDTTIEMDFDVGGDVLGGGGAEAPTGLSGSVSIKGKSAEKANPYDILESMISSVKSESGIFSINKLSGNLYIKDKPSVVRTVSRMLDQYKSMLSRQILIEARIIEVTLSKGYEYGIDWTLLRANSSASSIELSEIGWDLTNGLVLNGFNGHFSLSSVINALETFGTVKIVSNPTVRAKHGTPSIISVGDSISYKKSVAVTTEVNDGIETETTEVEVSTVFDGLILGVIPFIEPHGKINLLINPVKSDVDSESITASENVGGGLTISLPKVGIKEISTNIAVNTGDTIVLGGLISKENTSRDKDVPLLSRIPLLGYAFKNDYVNEERKELVIILNVIVL
jgi:MSHA type pilus biogenesis protein MshL